MYKALVRNTDAFGRTWAFHTESTAAAPNEAINDLKSFMPASLIPLKVKLKSGCCNAF